ncbi:MAG TPA: AAA family ATPase [Thermoflexus sp.]|nr:AAA family ATPase [Thermoflexus sp.]
MYIRRLIVRNFRSIEEMDLELAPITVVYGPNGSGKSSLLYALLTLRNAALMPNAAILSFFNYGFVNIGGFREVVFRHGAWREIKIGILVDCPWEEALRIPQAFQQIGYAVHLQENEGRFELLAGEGDRVRSLASITVSFPYPGTQQVPIPFDDKLTIVWNGVIAQVQPKEPDFLREAEVMGRALNAPVEALRRIRFVPLRRGFAQLVYSPIPITPFPITDGELATLLAQESDLEYAVDRFLEDIADRNFRVRIQLGTSVFRLYSVDRQTGIGVDLVNEAFGINQIVYLLAQALHPDAGLIAIEEPEIHLHPTVIRQLARALVRISQERKKQFLISTHSEVFITSLLAQVAERRLSPEELACYFAENRQGRSVFTRQQVNEHGQIEGGLRTFIEAELEDLQSFLGVPEAFG